MRSDSPRFSTPLIWLALATIPAALHTGCGPEFENCEAKRNCPTAGKGGAEEGGDGNVRGSATGGTQPSGGSAGTGGKSIGGEPGIGGTGGEVGSGGDSGADSVGSAGDSSSPGQGGATSNKGGSAGNGGSTSNSGGSAGTDLGGASDVGGGSVGEGGGAGDSGTGTIVCTTGYVLSGSKCLPGLEAVPTPTNSTVTGLSASGSVVVGNQSIGTGYRWDVGSAVPATFVGTVGAISGDGRRGAGCIGKDLAFWDAATTSQVVPSGNAVWDVCVRAASSDGAVVAGTLYDNDALLEYGFVWSSGSSYSYPTGPYDEYELFGLSGSGALAVGHGKDASNTWIPVWWSAQAQLTPLSGGAGKATAISRDGTVVVGWQSASAVRWSGAGYTTRQTLPTLPSTGRVGAVPNATSQNGSVTVGWSYVSDTTTEATIWTGAQVRTVREILSEANTAIAGWSLVAAVAVSDDGKVVVGDGTLAGTRRSWIARLP
jgi:uncharacterized membrane protein